MGCLGVVAVLSILLLVAMLILLAHHVSSDILPTLVVAITWNSLVIIRMVTVHNTLLAHLALRRLSHPLLGVV